MEHAPAPTTAPTAAPIAPPPGAEAAAPARGLPTSAMWVSAMVLLALIIVQATTSGTPARADLVSAAGDYTVLTFDGGNDDVLLVLDGRGEELYAYRVRNQNSLELIAPYQLKTIFNEARRIGAGGGK